MLDTAVILSICGLIIAIGGSVAYLNKLFRAINQPYKETRERLDKIEIYLDNDNKRIQELEAMIKQNTRAFNMSIKNDLVILRHLESDNNTGEMQETIKNLEEWLIDRKF